MKINELRELTVEELNARTRELRKEALHLRIQQASGQLENTAHLKDLRKEVARIETLVSERRIGIVRSGAQKSAADVKVPKAKAVAKKEPEAKKAPVKKTAEKSTVETKRAAKKAVAKKVAKKDAS